MNWLRKLLSGKKGEGSGDAGSDSPRPHWQQVLILLGLVFLGVVLVLGGRESNFPADKQQILLNQKQPRTAGQESVSGTDSRMNSNGAGLEQTGMSGEEKQLADKLQQMLSEVEGAGKVRVTVRLAASARQEFAVNTTLGHKITQEKDQSGGSREISENSDATQLVVVRGQNIEQPVVKQEQAAQIAGVLVVASGAADPQVKARLFQAVQVALAVPGHKILVLPAREG
ncbi:hypothetical protein [Desulfurispora thermophila]|uniref:hypothetical protein n=1 Tax=Desulfurispora thermophila TaxID=265470 RepID=UPI000365CFC1|nr:hypothetical protein [Desulfurispora thermophila]